MEWINAIVQGVLLGGLYALFAAINASSTVSPAIQCFAILNKTFSINCMPETTLSFHPY